MDEIRDIIHHIESRNNEQSKLISNIMKQNQQILQYIVALDRNIDTLISISTDTQDLGSYDLQNKVVRFRGKMYPYDKELLFDNPLLFPKNIDMKLKYPQGIEYVESFLKKKKCHFTFTNTKNSICFYFAFNSLDELDFNDTYRTISTASIAKFSSSQYSGDIYPQGRDYCLFLLKETKKNFNVNLPKSVSTLICARKSDIYTNYYFISECIPVMTNEKIRVKKGERELGEEIDAIGQMKKTEIPQGKIYCINMIEKQIAVNGQILIIEIPNKQIRYYYPYEEFELACCSTTSIVGKDNLINEKKLLAKRNVPQDPKYCDQLIDELIKNNGTLKLMRRDSNNKKYFFYQPK